MTIRPGQRIKPPDQKNNALSLSYLGMIVAVCNAILNLRIKGGKFLISDKNLEIEIDNLSSSSTQTAANCYKVKSVEADYLVCRLWDGTTEVPADVLVAKPHAARQPASETIAGTSYTYTYSDGPDALNDVRESDDGDTTEDQIVTPLWTTDGLIQVFETNFSGVTVDGADLKLIEVGPRCWAKVEAPA